MNLTSRGFKISGVDRAIHSTRAKVALVAAFLALVAQPAIAQDAASPFAGFYVGVHTGIGSANADFAVPPYTANLPSNDVPVAGRNDNFEPAGWLLRAQGGYNFVNDRNVLFGIEGDWSWLGTSDRAAGSETVLLGPPPVFGLDLRQEYNFQYVS